MEVKPSYGLTDEQVEEMLMAALDFGEQDLVRRRLVEERVEAERILQATDKALAEAADLIASESERRRIDDALSALREAVGQEDPRRIAARVEALADATHAWAGRRMDRAIARAIAGQNIGTVEQTVSHAQGVDAHVAEHAARATQRQGS